jgi:hypothetical protein
MPIVFAAMLLAVSIAAPSPSDGRHDFDFEIGSWTMAPSGYGHVVRALWDGATIAQLIVPIPVRHVRGSLLSLYDPNRHRWNVYWADATDGSLSKPLTGTFRNGIGTFTGPDTRAGHPIVVRLVYDHIAANSFQTERSESTDNGRTWSRAVKQTYSRNPVRPG